MNACIKIKCQASDIFLWLNFSFVYVWSDENSPVFRLPSKVYNCKKFFILLINQIYIKQPLFIFLKQQLLF